MYGYILSQLLVNSMVVVFEDDNCTNFMSIGDGKWNQVVLRRGEYIELMLMNKSGDYMQYRFPNTTINTFDWVTKSINGHPMHLTYSRGDVQITLDRVTFYCPITSVGMDKLLPPSINYTEPLVHCRWEDKTVVSSLIGLSFLVLISFVFGNRLPDAIKAIKLLTIQHSYRETIPTDPSFTTTAL